MEACTGTPAGSRFHLVSGWNCEPANRYRPPVSSANGGFTSKVAGRYFLLRRWWRVLRSSLRCFFLAIRFRRFLITEPTESSQTFNRLSGCCPYRSAIRNYLILTLRGAKNAHSGNALSCTEGKFRAKRSLTGYSQLLDSMTAGSTRRRPVLTGRLSHVRRLGVRRLCAFDLAVHLCMAQVLLHR